MTAAAWSRGNRIGLIMTIVMGFTNIVLGMIHLPDLLNTSGTVADGPPAGVLAINAVLGVIMIVLTGYALATVSRNAATAASVANILQGLTVVPAFLTPAPLAWRLLAIVIIGWTTVSVALTLSRSRAMRGA
jgi:hypothetical protein